VTRRCFRAKFVVNANACRCDSTRRHTADSRATRARLDGTAPRSRSIPSSVERTVRMAPACLVTRAFEDDENCDEICDAGDARGRTTKYWLRRRCSTGSHASASTNILGGGVGDNSNESDQATTRLRRSATTSSSKSVASEGRDVARLNSGQETPGHFAFATPMSNALRSAATTPRTPRLTAESPDGARLDALLAAPLKPNFGTRSVVEKTPDATPLKLRFDNIEIVRSSGGGKKRKRGGRVSDVFKATKSTTPRVTRAQKKLS